MGSFRLGGTLTPAVKGILIANLAVFLLQAVVGDELIYLFGLTPAAIWREFPIWQPLTYMFLHGGLSHIFFNMLMLWMFGGTLESNWGTKYFLRYYFITGVGAGIASVLLTPGLDIPIVGASGAIFGLLAAYGLLFPNSQIYIYGLFPIKAKVLVIICAVISFMGSVSPGMSPIAHLAHLSGMLIGVFYLRQDRILRWLARKIKGVQAEQTVKKEKKQERSEDYLRTEVDDLLDKINEVGIENLTSWEKRRLRDASEKLRQMEKDE